jgi:hypothetical protein
LSGRAGRTAVEQQAEPVSWANEKPNRQHKQFLMAHSSSKPKSVSRKNDSRAGTGDRATRPVQLTKVTIKKKDFLTGAERNLKREIQSRPTKPVQEIETNLLEEIGTGARAKRSGQR